MLQTSFLDGSDLSLVIPLIDGPAIHPGTRSFAGHYPISETDREITTLKESLFINDQFESLVMDVKRTCYRGMRVRVYRNLNKPEFFSIMAMEGVNKKKIVGYARAVLLENCEFIVSEASRQRVIRQKRKNVHAFCEGAIMDASSMLQPLLGDEQVITYNPYCMSTFFERETGAPYVDSCPKAMLQGSNIYL